MKAAIFEAPGLDNLKVIDTVDEPKVGDHDVLIKVKLAGVNPIDHFVVSGMLPRIVPFPHIPGAESSGIVEQVGSEINDGNMMSCIGKFRKRSAAATFRVIRVPANTDNLQLFVAQ